jgi:hypothetical protein
MSGDWLNGGFSRRWLPGVLAGFAMGCRGLLLADEASGSVGVFLRPDPWPSTITQVRYRSRVTGTLSTPTASGKSDYKLESQGDFEFLQRVAALPPGSSGLLRASRQFTTAKTRALVGGNHETITSLPEGARRILLSSLDNSLTQFSPDVRLSRPQLDLLNFPLDPLAVAGLLPSRAVMAAGERWNVDNRTVALLCGFDAVISQTTVCSLEQLSEQRAVVGFSCEASGAVSGSAADVETSGTLVLDRSSGLLTSLRASIREKRSPGAISPGLDVRGDVEWSQSAGATGATGLPEDLPETGADPRQLLLTLVTPWDLMLLHDRDWHVFQQTPELMLLRRISGGALIAQCNLSRGPQLNPGQHASEAEFLADVERRTQERRGQIESSNVRSDVNGWRIHHVRALAVVPAADPASGAGQGGLGKSAVGGADSAAGSDRRVFWDYYLCTAAGGEQYSLVFSHLEEDAAAFGNAADRMLGTLTLRSARPRVALPR